MPEREWSSMMKGLIMLVISVIVLVILGLVFFTIDLWIVKTAADVLDINADGGLMVLSAAILSAAALIGSKAKHS